MTTNSPVVRRRFTAWLSPSGIAAGAGAAGAAISTRAPGGHEQANCGNALSLDLGPWRFAEAREYHDATHRDCTSQRVDCVAYAVGAVSVTGLS